ncbi:hypothetical protein BCR39DRAFT_554685 [Naematelia encephala]|uniref:Uncharacterized protein n=1 Tax=Naematelia encephala TaxID=71784 RepID=A0A1Y2AE34_9TREE|nr:hypothetical protein BCR39DRAFT_554685 [Naematelia encephala]
MGRKGILCISTTMPVSFGHIRFIPRSPRPGIRADDEIVPFSLYRFDHCSGAFSTPEAMLAHYDETHLREPVIDELRGRKRRRMSRRGEYELVPEEFRLADEIRIRHVDSQTTGDVTTTTTNTTLSHPLPPSFGSLPASFPNALPTDFILPPREIIMEEVQVDYGSFLQSPSPERNAMPPPAPSPFVPITQAQPPSAQQPLPQSPDISRSRAGSMGSQAGRKSLAFGAALENETLKPDTPEKGRSAVGGVGFTWGLRQ